MMIEKNSISKPFEVLETLENSRKLLSSPKFPRTPGIIILLAILLATVGCKEDAPSAPDLSAAYAAKEYYDSLFFSHNVAFFVDARYQADSIPPQYRRSLLAAARQYASELTALNGRLDSISVVSCYPDAELHCTQTHLRLNFHNGNSETVLVPMQKSGGKWWMR